MDPDTAYELLQREFEDCEDDEYESGKVYSDFHAHCEDEHIPAVAVRRPVKSSKVTLIRLWHARQTEAQTCYLLFVGKSLLRAIVGYLEFKDFFVFTGSCKHFRELLTDPYLDIKPPGQPQAGYLFRTPPTAKDIFECILHSQFTSGLKMQMISFAGTKHTNTFHVESGVWMYSYYEDVVTVWRVRPGTDATEDVALIQCLPGAEAISGFEDWVAAVNQSEVCVVSRNSKPGLEFMARLESYAKFAPWNYGKVISLHWVSAGQHIIAAGSHRFTVLSPSLELLSTVQFEDDIRFVHIEKVTESIVISYHGSILSVYNFKKSLSESTFQIARKYVLTVRNVTVRNITGRKDYLITHTSECEVHINASKSCFMSNVDHIALCGNFLFVLKPKVLHVFELGVSQVKPYKEFSFPGDYFALIPLQEKLIAVQTLASEVAIAFCKYNRFQSPMASHKEAIATLSFYSFSLPVKSVSTAQMFDQILLLKGTTKTGEDYSVVVNTALPVQGQRISGVNSVLVKPQPEYFGWSYARHAYVKVPPPSEKPSNYYF